jgi:uncharacterized CHY-type Zn-finger protein
VLRPWMSACPNCSSKYKASVATGAIPCSMVAEKDADGKEVLRRYVLDPKDKELVTCRRCRHIMEKSVLEISGAQHCSLCRHSLAPKK